MLCLSRPDLTWDGILRHQKTRVFFSMLFSVPWRNQRKQCSSLVLKILTKNRRNKQPPVNSWIAFLYSEYHTPPLNVNERRLTHALATLDVIHACLNVYEIISMFSKGNLSFATPPPLQNINFCSSCEHVSKSSQDNLHAIQRRP